MLTSTHEPGTDLVEAVVDGPIDGTAIADLRRLLEATAAQHDGVRVLVEVRRFTGLGPKAVQEDLRALGLLRILRRYAVVATSGPLRAAARAALVVLPVEGRVLEHRDEALAWLRA